MAAEKTRQRAGSFAAHEPQATVCPGPPAKARAYFKWAGLFPGGGLHPEDDPRDIMNGEEYIFTKEEADLVNEASHAAWEHFQGDPFELPEYDIDFVLANS